MAHQIFALPKQVNLDSAANTLAGAKAYFYLTTTTTPADVYADSGLVTPLSNPVVADATGVFVPIYMNPAVIYKLVLKTSADVTLYTADPANEQLLSQAIVGAYLNPRTSAEVSAAVTPTNYAIPSHEGVGHVNPARYGFATSASGAANAAALTSAVAVAAAAGSCIRTSDAQYDYTPAARLDITVPWLSEGLTTLMVDTSAYTGIVFQQTGSTELRGLQIIASDVSGTGIRQMATPTTDFTGYQTLRRVWVLGFDKNLDVGNTFLNIYDNVRANDGNEGFYCVPPTNGGDNGYITTHVHINCEYRDNARNINYDSTLQSRGVVFLGGSSEAPTTDPSQFVRVRGLKFIDFYCEASSGIRALLIDDCSSSVEGIYLNGTAGIQLGSNTEITFKGVRFGTATDVLTGGDGSQIVSMEDCQWPSSGNVIDFARFAATNTHINGAWLSRFYGNNDDVAITPTLRGSSTAGTPTYTVQAGYANRVGSMLHVRGRLVITAIGGMTGNLQIGGLPSAAVNQPNGYASVSIVQGGLTNSVNYSQFGAWLQPNSAVIDVVEMGSGQSVSLVPIANVAANTQIIFSVSYAVD
jgi:hypothetical protein